MILATSAMTGTGHGIQPVADLEEQRVDDRKRERQPQAEQRAPARSRFDFDGALQPLHGGS